MFETLRQFLEMQTLHQEFVQLNWVYGVCEIHCLANALWWFQ